MSTDKQTPLSQLFSQLPFATLADEWLESLNGKGITEQLCERRIVRVEILPLISSGGLGIEEDGNFFVLLNDMNTPEENAASLGHELAHTFHYDLGQTPPLNTLGQDLSDDLVEEFCDSFSACWLARNSKERVALCCKNQASLVIASAVFEGP